MSALRRCWCRDQHRDIKKGHMHSIPRQSRNTSKRLLALTLFFFCFFQWSISTLSTHVTSKLQKRTFKKQNKRWVFDNNMYAVFLCLCVTTFHGSHFGWSHKPDAYITVSRSIQFSCETVMSQLAGYILSLHVRILFQDLGEIFSFHLEQEMCKHILQAS